MFSCNKFFPDFFFNSSTPWYNFDCYCRLLSLNDFIAIFSSFYREIFPIPVFPQFFFLFGNYMEDTFRQCQRVECGLSFFLFLLYYHLHPPQSSSKNIFQQLHEFCVLFTNMSYFNLFIAILSRFVSNNQFLSSKPFLLLFSIISTFFVCLLFFLRFVRIFIRIPLNKCYVLIVF